MLPLLFILFVTGVSILVTYHFSEDVTWFTFYIGGVVGLLASSTILEIWTRRKRKKTTRN